MSDLDVAALHYMVELVDRKGIPLGTSWWKRVAKGSAIWVWGGRVGVQIIHRGSGLVVWQRHFNRSTKARALCARVERELVDLSDVAFRARYDEGSFEDGR